MLAAELIRAQGIEVLAIFFETPFFSSRKAVKSAQSIDLPLKVKDLTQRHLEIVRRPRHGYGGNMNPCIDCHSLMFRVAGEMLKKEHADFVISGEVLGQRPMSQNKKALSLVALESGIDKLLVRPLSAKHLEITIPEEAGWVSRELLMDFQGRSRKPQMKLAKRLNISEYPSPGGGCLLTEKAFSRRLRELFSSPAAFGPREIELLKLGRHFRISENTKIIVGRNKKENDEIQSLSGSNELVITSASVPGPTVLVSGNCSKVCIETAAALAAAYSDAEKNGDIGVEVASENRKELFMVSVRDKKDFKHYMI